MSKKQNHQNLPVRQTSVRKKSWLKRSVVGALAAGVTTLAVSSGALASPFHTIPINPLPGDWWRDIRLPSYTEVQPNHILEQLVPTALLSGDREFNGNGPQVNSSVTLRVSADRRSIMADVYFRAAETKSDWSTTEARWEKKIYEAPAGRTIKRIVGAVRPDGTVDTALSSSVEFISRKAGFQVLGPTQDFKEFADAIVELVEMILDLAGAAEDSEERRTAGDIIDAYRTGRAWLPESENHVHVMPAGAGPVEAFAIVGDTGGPDISTDLNGKDDTRINSILFKPLRVEFN